MGIAVSTFGFLAQGILTAPRVYYAMAQDGVFFERVGRLHPRTLFAIACWLVVLATIHRYPGDSVIGLGILALGLPVYRLWNVRSRSGRQDRSR